MSRFASMMLSEFTIKQVSRYCLFFFGAILIFCTEAMIINHVHDSLPIRLDPDTSVNTGASPLHISTPIWFDLGEKKRKPEERQLFIAATQFLLILSGLIGSTVGILLRPRPSTLLLAAVLGSCMLSTLFIASFPASALIVTIAGCTSFCCAATFAALPYTLWHYYLIRG